MLNEFVYPLTDQYRYTGNRYSKIKKGKKTLLLFALLIVNCTLIIDNCFPQSGWFPQNISVQNLVFTSSCFINENTGWIADMGGYGRIVKTTNGGNNWVVADSIGPSYYLYDIKFVNAYTGWVVGMYTEYYKKIMKTTNGGSNWIEQNISSVSFSPKALYFLDTNTGWVGGISGSYGVLIKTTNGGNNWVNNTPSSTSFREILCMYFLNENTGYIGGSSNPGRIYKTTNGGNNWTTQTTAITGLYNWLRSVTFINDNTGWIVSDNGLINKTTDGGNNWFNQVSGTTSSLRSVFFCNQNTGYIAGYSGIILKTTNSGNSWTQQVSGVNQNLNNTFFVNDSTGWVVGTASIILKTTNGGLITGFTCNNPLIPGKYNLSQNYPNPFNPKTVIRYQLSVDSRAVLKVYDIMGKEVATLVDEKQNPGTYEVAFDGSNLASGTYFYRLTAGEFTDTKKLMLLK